MKIVDTGLWNGEPYAIIEENGNVLAHSVADSESGIHSQEGLKVITSRIAALEAQNKKLVEALTSVTRLLEVSGMDDMGGGIRTTISTARALLSEVAQ